jgi:hypothetical protein
MSRIFSYLDLPQIPPALERECLKNIDLIDNDKRLNYLNTLEGIGHSITYVPTAVRSWLNTRIYSHLFGESVPTTVVDKTMLHVSHYIKHKEGTGVHPTHVDYGRNYAINYIINTGGKSVETYWCDESNTKEFSVIIQPRRWHIIEVNPARHGVSGIVIGQLRTIISVCFSPEDMNSFDFNNTFGKFLID